MASIGATIRRYRVPLLVAAGGLVAYQAYSSIQQGRQAALAAQLAAATPAGGGSPLTPEQVAALIAQGSQLTIAGQTPLVDLASGGLNLAAVLGTGAQSLAAVLAGSQVQAATTLGQLAGTAISILPNLAPPSGYPAQPVTAPKPPTPAPAPTPTPAPTLVGYRMLTPPVSGSPALSHMTLFSAYSGGTARHVTFTHVSNAPVARGPVAGAWKITGGGYTGWWCIAGKSGAFTIQRIYRSAAGVLSYQTISATGI